MSEKIETSTAKEAHKELAADPENEKREIQVGKRRRESMSLAHDTESPLKVRKKSPQKAGSDMQENEKSNCTTVSTSASNCCKLNIGSQTDEDFDFGNDSALLSGLLEDFSQEDPVVKSTKASSEHNGTCDKNTTQNQEATDKITVSNQDLLDSQFDGEFDDIFDEEYQEDEDKKEEDGIDFQEFKCCRVLEISVEKKFTKIKVEHLEEKNTATVLCYDFWTFTRTAVDDIVSIKATKKSGNWTIDNENGFLITQPHTLVSGTTVVGSIYCLRRSVLRESFRDYNILPNTEVDITAMTIGSLVHEVLQKVLRRELSTIAEIKSVLNEILSSRAGIQMLYESNLTERDCRQRIGQYIPKIFQFIKRYVIGDGVKTWDENFSGKIDRIRDIEENIWLPELGLKGKIDVTVDVNVNEDVKIMPLEVKSGQPSFSLEHKGQLMLYNMMLEYLGHQVDSGLLLYIKDNVMQEIKSNHHAKRDLIALRNSFVYYAEKMPKLEEIEREDGSVEITWRHVELPEPISNPRACSNCELNVLCSVYAKKDEDLELSESHVLKTVQKEAEKVLTPAHIDYILKWIVMTKIESTGGRNPMSHKDLWLMEPSKREAKGVCISNLTASVTNDGDNYLHTFTRNSAPDNCSDNAFSRVNFTESDYIIVSTDTRINVAAGFISSQTEDKIEMLLTRNVVSQNPAAKFHLDKLPFAGMTKLGLTNIACLLNNHEITNKLRAIIIDKQPATFVPKLPRSVAVNGASILYRLNKYQRLAVLKALSANDYLLIRGMPGTGKTQTLVALIEVFVKMGQSVLVTAHTHSAVDNIMLKLDEKEVDFLRLGSHKRTNPTLKHKAEDVLVSECTTVESLDAVYKSKKVVGVTCCGAIHRLLSKRIFDVCLVDESTQVLQSTVLKPIFSAKKFILVGDPEQLPPVVQNHNARKMGMCESLFSRLDSDNNRVTLELQYRMNRKVMSVANEMTYEGAMKCGTSDVAAATLRLTDTMVLESCERWISRCLSLDLEDSVVMLNTGRTHLLREKFEGGNRFHVEIKRVHNVAEATIVMRLVTVLLKGGLDAKSIGVISPFTAQVELLRKLCQENIEINTVDQYQGRDKDVILYSCTRSEPTSSYAPSEFEILQDRQRLNVAITRAKHKLIVVCDKETLDRYTPFKKLFSIIKDDNVVNLEPGQDDFEWESLLRLIE